MKVGGCAVAGGGGEAVPCEAVRACNPILQGGCSPTERSMFAWLNFSPLMDIEDGQLCGCAVDG